jgi:hypothetical protein
MHDNQLSHIKSLLALLLSPLKRLHEPYKPTNFDP